MARPNNKQIEILVKKTEEFAVEELCPLMEKMGILENPNELRASLAATLQSTGAAIGHGVIRIKKKGNKYSSINTVFDDEPDEEEKEEAEDQDEKIAAATKNLLDMCVELGRDKAEIQANVAAAALSMLLVGRDSFGNGWFRTAILNAISL